MLIGDFICFPKELPKSNETELEVTDTLLVHTVPSVIKGLPIAFGLHSDEPINKEVQLTWEIYGDAKRLGDFGGPVQLNLAKGEVYKSAFTLPDSEAPAEDKYTFVLFADNDRLMDVELEIRLPRE